MPTPPLTPDAGTPLVRLLRAVDGCDAVRVDWTYQRLFVARGGLVQAFDARGGQAWDAPWPLDGRSLDDAVAERVARGY